MKKDEAGFSLIELMMAVGLLAIVAGAAFAMLSYYQKNYVGTQERADMHSGVRGAVELMSQELAQAGLLNSVDGVSDNQLASADLSSGTAQAVSVKDPSMFYVGESVMVDTGLNAESVVIQAVDNSTKKITGIFTQNHPSGAPIYAVGVIGQGIAVTSSKLDLIGDISADGNLYMVEYVCDPTNSHTLTRSATVISAASKSAANALVTNVTECTFSNATTTVNGTNYVTNIGLTITVRTDDKDPQTGQYGTMKRSYLDLSPRNIAGAVALAQAGVNNRIQPTPPCGWNTNCFN